MVFTPSFANDFSAAALTYSAPALRSKLSVNPNFVARKISSLLPVRLNLAECQQNEDGLYYDTHLPFPYNLFGVIINICGVPVSTPQFIGAIQQLQ
jgi:hypothetical protein